VKELRLRGVDLDAEVAPRENGADDVERDDDARCDALSARFGVFCLGRRDNTKVDGRELAWERENRRGEEREDVKPAEREDDRRDCGWCKF
jgi:hypothetical protein